MNFTFIILPRALADLRSATRWLAENISKASAHRWSDRFDSAIRLVVNDPHRHRRAHEADGLGIDLREALFGRKPHVYRILFTIEGSVVNVHHVRHAARDSLTDADF